MLNKHKTHILNVMEKFDIIIRPTKSDIYPVDENTCNYYVPCMIKEEPELEIDEMFNATEDTCTKSTWFCLKFRFLPPHLMNHLAASLCRKYAIAESSVTKQEKSKGPKKRIIVTNHAERVVAVFRATAVFELENSKLSKLLVMTHGHFIQIQILKFEKSAIFKRGMYRHIADFVIDEINKIIDTRFKMTNVRFEKKWECGLTKPESVVGSNNFSEDKFEKYYCETCKATHLFKGEWSDPQIKELCLLKSSQETSNTNPQMETKSETQMFSTKVRVHIQGGTKTLSQVSEESTKTCSLQGCSKEEINFAKMGMIALNILADILFDLLKQDKKNLRARSECDITYLYSELRGINRHIPSNGWGGSWQRIQNTDIAIGDDIERIRLTRNELQHSKIFSLPDIRYNELHNIIVDVVKRFDQHNKPARLYTVHLNEMNLKSISTDEVKVLQHQIKHETELGMTFEVEIEHQLNV